MFLAETNELDAPQQTASTEVITESDINQHLQNARQQVQEGNYEEALSDYLYAFDNSRGMPRFSGARLSNFPNEIAQLGAQYPLALAAMRQRREANEKLIFSGKGGYAQMQELMAINRYLEGEDKNLALYDRFNETPSVPAELRDKIVSFVWKQLADAKRYQELDSRIVKLARRVAAKIMEYQLAIDFPGTDIEASPEYLDYLRQSIVKDGGRAYEVLLGLGKDDIAEKLLHRLLGYQASGHMYVTLIDRAISCGRYSIARRLYKRASNELTDEYDVAIVNASEERIPADDEVSPTLSFSPI